MSQPMHKSVQAMSAAKLTRMTTGAFEIINPAETERWQLGGSFSRNPFRVCVFSVVSYGPPDSDTPNPPGILVHTRLDQPTKLGPDGDGIVLADELPRDVSAYHAHACRDLGAATLSMMQPACPSPSVELPLRLGPGGTFQVDVQRMQGGDMLMATGILGAR